MKRETDRRTQTQILTHSMKIETDRRTHTQILTHSTQTVPNAHTLYTQVYTANSYTWTAHIQTVSHAVHNRPTS